MAGQQLVNAALDRLEERNEKLEDQLARVKALAARMGGIRQGWFSGKEIEQLIKHAIEGEKL